MKDNLIVFRSKSGDTLQGKAESIAKQFNKKGAVILTYDCDEEYQYVSVAFEGLTFNELLYALGMGISDAYKLLDDANSKSRENNEPNS